VINTERIRKQVAPLTDTVIIAVAQLVGDAQSGTREPSHSDIEFPTNRCDLTPGDPRAQGQQVGKEKRVRETLSWAIENDYPAGEALVAGIVSLIKACGGFRKTSPNYVGSHAIENAIDAFRAEGYELTTDGELHPVILDKLFGLEATEALRRYVRRVQRGADDAALVTGTGKDLLEATAAHVLVERYGTYPSASNFPTLLGQVFVELGLATSHDPRQPSETPSKRLERAMYETACAINQLRNKEGTGHGRPWIPSVTDAEAKAAVNMIGAIAEFLLAAHNGSG
jgi:hypothetical protein